MIFLKIFSKQTACLLSLIFLLSQCEPIPYHSSAPTKKMVFEDYNYEDIVGNVRLVPITNGEVRHLDNPVISLSNATQLYLEFDILAKDSEDFEASFIHCNRDWKKSVLQDIEFMNEINDIRISQNEFSVGTNQPFIKYKIVLPKPSLSGNYIVTIYRQDKPEDKLFNRRFLVTEGKVSIEYEMSQSYKIDRRRSHQQMEITLKYGRVSVQSPQNDIMIAILQNHRWIDAKVGLQPTQIDNATKILKYLPINTEIDFFGGNEFRFFDITSLTSAGRRVKSLNFQAGKVHAYLSEDEPRNNASYSVNFGDMNGNYYTQNENFGGTVINEDYAKVHFFIKTEPLNNNVYVIGRYNNWNMNNSNLMVYNGQRSGYEGAIFAKQGFYNYLYYVQDDTNPYALEGSYFPTENDYEILVYARQTGDVVDKLVGYVLFNTARIKK